MALSLQDLKREIEPPRPSHRGGLFHLNRLWSPGKLQWLLIFGGVLVLILLGLQFAWNPAPDRRRISLDPDRPVQVLMNLQFALDQYALRHDGQYPATLLQLIPLYVADTSDNRRAFRVLDYRVDERTGYRLQLTGQPSPSAEDLVATRDGFRLPGFEKVLGGGR